MVRAKRKPAPSVELRTALLAYLMGDQGLSSGAAYRVINAKYPYRQSAVAEDIQRAKERGWLVQRFGSEHFSMEMLDELRVLAHNYEDLERKLKSNSGHALKTLKVFFSGADPKSSRIDDWTIQAKLFASRASGYVMELLRPASIIGVACSGTVSSIVDGIVVRASAQQVRSPKTAYFIPTGGEPMYATGSVASSTNLAIRLAEAMNGRYDASHSPSLRSVPALVPKEFQGDRRKVVLEFIARMGAYKEIFKDTLESGTNQPSWISRLECILCSCGSLQKENFYRSELIDIGGIGERELARLSIGDIGGVLIEREGLSKSERQKFREIANLWTGIKLEDFQRVATNASASSTASRSQSPGVVLCAYGKHRGEITSKLVTVNRVVNHLVIDHSLALELARIHDAQLTLGYHEQRQTQSE